jgi:hypothetical protein
MEMDGIGAGRVLHDDGDLRFVELSVTCEGSRDWGHAVVQKVVVFGEEDKVILRMLHSTREPVEIDLTFEEMDILGEAFQAFCQSRGYTFEKRIELSEEGQRFLDDLPF